MLLFDLFKEMKLNKLIKTDGWTDLIPQMIFRLN